MTRISKRKLNENLEKQMYDLFWSALSQSHSSLDTAAFFTDLLSETEKVMLAKRFMIAILLERGKNTIEISTILGASFSMISNVSRWRMRASPATRKILEIIIKQQNIELFFDTIDEMLDVLPPMYGTNWKRAGKEKWNRKVERNARASLK